MANVIKLLLFECGKECGPLQCKLQCNNITMIVFFIMLDFFHLFDNDHSIARLCLLLSCVFQIANQPKIHR